MTLTHDCETPWSQNRIVENNTLAPGLTDFGKNVIQEMNRIGMMVDISHTSKEVMLDAMKISAVPVIFSHSSALNVTNTTYALDDEVIKKLQEKEGVIMINFGSRYVNTNNDATNMTATMNDVIAHLDYIKSLTNGSAEFVGIGANFGEPDDYPEHLGDVKSYPDLFDELARKGWSKQDLYNLAGGNILRVMKAVDDHVEELRKNGNEYEIYENTIPLDDLEDRVCRSNRTET